ncbi:MAG: SUMF1/EgtB/PvdO family nonheme iron enzyme [Acidobacteria bacterium]|nr:SUMF1/EgtB/PvdO family nonheme iron enzyme [Acidobacteriota bacterium]
MVNGRNAVTLALFLAVGSALLGPSSGCGRLAPQARKPDTSPTLTDPGGPDMVLVAAGQAWLGLGEEDFDWVAKKEGPEEGKWFKETYKDRGRRSVTLPAFYLGRFEVTNEEYAKFVKATSRPAPSFRSKDGHVLLPSWVDGAFPKGLERHPVVLVSWEDAIAYCEWLSRSTGRRYRLPTEDEWEKAASWDEKAGRKLRYPWGDDLKTWEGAMDRDPHGCAFRSVCTRPVGSSPADRSPYGLEDMGGNVAEWVGGRGATNAKLKGGSFLGMTPRVRWMTAVSIEYPAGDEGKHIWRGFRVAREP